MASERTRLATGVALAALAGLCCIVSGCSRPMPAAAKGADSGERTTASEAPPALPKEGPLPGRALIYAEMQGKQAGRSVTLYDLSWDVMWLPGAGGGAARTVYVGGPKRVFNGRLPAHLGFIPSPDGRWLCVWETHYCPRGQWSDALQTVWTMVKLPEGSKREIHVQPGLAGYFPLWLDNYRLQLEKGDLRAVFDVRTNELSPDLPSGPTASPSRGSESPTYGPPQGEENVWYTRLQLRDIDDDTQAAVAWRRNYLAQRLPGDRDVLDKALQTLPAELGLADYLMAVSRPETPDDLLLRPLGVVGLWGRWVRYDKTVWPSIAISPDHRLIARAAVLRTGQTFQLRRWWNPEDAPEVSNTFEARADVFDVSSGRHVWGISVPRPSTVSLAASVSVSVQECWFNDLRWSEDGRYLSFTWNQPPFGSSWVSVVDASTWREVLRVCNGSNAFIVPDASRAR